MTDRIGMDGCDIICDDGGLGGIGGDCILCEGPSMPPPNIPNWSGIPLPGPGQGPDPMSMIIDNYHQDENGYYVGDRPGEHACFSHPGEACTDAYWNDDTQEWDTYESDA